MILGMSEFLGGGKKPVPEGEEPEEGAALARLRYRFASYEWDRVSRPPETRPCPTPVSQP